MHVHSRCTIPAEETPRVTVGVFRHILLVKSSQIASQEVEIQAHVSLISGNGKIADVTQS